MPFSTFLCIPLGSQRGRDKVKREVVVAAVERTDPPVPPPTWVGLDLTNASNPGPSKPATPPQESVLPKPVTTPQEVAPPKPDPIPAPPPKTIQPSPPPKVQPQVTKKPNPVAPALRGLPAWEHETIGHILNVTLDVRVSILC